MCIKRVGKLRDQSIAGSYYFSPISGGGSHSQWPLFVHTDIVPMPTHPPCTVHTGDSSQPNQTMWVTSLKKMHPEMHSCTSFKLATFRTASSAHLATESVGTCQSNIFLASYNIRNAFMRERITKLISSRTWNDWPCPDAHCPNPHGPPSNLRPMRKQFYLMIFS